MNLNYLHIAFISDTHFVKKKILLFLTSLFVYWIDSDSKN